MTCTAVMRHDKVDKASFRSIARLYRDKMALDITTTCMDGICTALPLALVGERELSA